MPALPLKRAGGKFRGSAAVSDPNQHVPQHSLPRKPMALLSQHSEARQEGTGGDWRCSTALCSPHELSNSAETEEPLECNSEPPGTRRELSRTSSFQLERGGCPCWCFPQQGGCTGCGTASAVSGLVAAGDLQPRCHCPAASALRRKAEKRTQSTETPPLNTFKYISLSEARKSKEVGYE